MVFNLYSQVDAFIEAHDTGLTDAERELAKGDPLISIQFN